MAAIQYLVNFNGQQSGPHSGDEIVSMLAQGKIDGTAVVWSDGWANWLLVQQAIPAASAQPQPQAAPQPTAQQAAPGADRCWQVQDRGSQYGPYTQAELAAYALNGSVSAAAMVWRQGMPHWVPVGSVVAVAAAPPMSGPGPVVYNGMPPGYSSNRVTAGILAILLGGLGIHKFMLGFTGAALTMLLVSVFGSCLYALGPLVMSVIGVIEGIIYLSKSDAQFYQDYVINKKQWF